MTSNGGRLHHYLNLAMHGQPVIKVCVIV